MFERLDEFYDLSFARSKWLSRRIWRAAKGKVFLDLPAQMIQLELFER